MDENSEKTLSYGLEYYSICCGESGMLFAIELVMGKDAHKEMLPLEFNTYAKTLVLLLRLCKCIFSTGKVFIL